MLRQQINDRLKQSFYTLILSGIFCILNCESKAQILFAEECFTGGVTVAGISIDGAGLARTCEIKWEDDFILRRAYAITYRYGRPEPYTIFINNSPVTWNIESQAGPEQIESHPSQNYFAPHVKDVTENIIINNQLISVDFPEIESSNYWNYFGIHVVILYESPSITDYVCSRIYIANQNQEVGQSYQFLKPIFKTNTPVLFSIYADRLTELETDRSRISLNNNVIGDVWSPDLIPITTFGVHGTFYYENEECFGLNGDTANTTVYKHDGIAVINQYLTSDPIQDLSLFRVESAPWGGANPHPAFTLTYTPECPVTDVDIQRTYAYCRGGEVQLTAEAGYENYEWTPTEGLSDASIANPVCSRDSSGWYQVRMSNADGCSQTIPVHVEVSDYPVPEDILVSASVCPQNTGAVVMENTLGALPITYQVNALENSNGSFTELAPGNYQIINTTAHGCAWDTTVTIEQNPLHEAAFTANPETGYTPLSVFFNNESTQISTGYQWLIDGQPVSTNENLSQQFPDSGTYSVELIAYYQEETCADTASFTLIVYPGLKLVIPNIITPNGDGFNDTLVAQVQGISSATWQVYNRWGNELHQGIGKYPDAELELWTPSPNEFPSGVYTLSIAVRSESGQVKEKVVNVTLKN